MADRTGIEWTDRTWNPVSGCDRVSPGCDNCYAMSMARRLKAMGSAGYQQDGSSETSGPGFGVSVHDDRVLTEPLRWRKPRRVFVDSMGDLFHADVPDDVIARVFAVMAAAPQHTFQVLTKRHGRMRSLLSSGRFWLDVASAADTLGVDVAEVPGALPFSLPNVWLGVSAEDQKHADLRVPALLDTPAAVRWVSAEPLLGPIDLTRWLRDEDDVRLLDWIVVGGESGAGARPMHPGWPRSLRDQCGVLGVPFLFKQWGEWAPGTAADRRTATVAVVARTGEWVQPAWALWDAPAAYHADLNRMDWTFVHRAGKKAAGRELDGQVHDGYPEPATQGG